MIETSDDGKLKLKLYYLHDLLFVMKIIVDGNNMREIPTKRIWWNKVDIDKTTKGSFMISQIKQNVDAWWYQARTPNHQSGNWKVS